MMLSPTGINTYRKCPRKFYFYIKRAPTLVPAFKEALEFGKTIHEIIAHYYEIIPEDLVPDEVKIWVRKAMIDIIHDEMPEMRQRIEKQLLNFIAFEKKRLTWHMSVRPVAVEKEFVKDSVHGIVDALFRRGNDLVVVDWKTGKGQADLTDDIIVQLNVYMWLTGAKTAYALFLEYGTFREVPYKIDIEELVQTIKEDKRFLPNRGSHCKFCEYQILCMRMDNLININESMWWLE